MCVQAGQSGVAIAQPVAIEQLDRDDVTLTDEQRMAAVMADAPELTVLLSELQNSLAEVRSHVGPILQEVCLWQMSMAQHVVMGIEAISSCTVQSTAELLGSIQVTC